MPDRSCADRYRTRSARFASALSVALGLAIAAGGMVQAAAPVQSSLNQTSLPPANPSQGTPSREAQSGAEAQASNALIRTVEEFSRAQQGFDAGRLAALTTSNYLEISPVGEVDSREEMLGFYAPDKKTAAPELAISDVDVRIFGDAGILIARIAYKARPPGQAVRTMELRAGFVAHRVSGDWKIASTQYTGIRAAPK
jgi:ketosteroid isomerase-like protein